jgi:hypothetical protein
MFRKQLAAMMMMTIGLSSVALGWDSPGGVAPTGTVKWISIGPDGRFHFKLTGTVSLCGTVGSGDTTIGTVLVTQTTTAGAVTDEGARALLSTLTAAKLSGKTIRVYADNNTGYGCKVGVIDLDP